MKVSKAHVDVHSWETVLRDYSDGTLVLFMGGFSSFRDQKENQRELLSVIEQRLKHHKKYSTSVSLGHTLEVLLSVHGQKILLQILPAFDPLCECSRDWGGVPNFLGIQGATWVLQAEAVTDRLAISKMGLANPCLSHCCCNRELRGCVPSTPAAWLAYTLK